MRCRGICGPWAVQLRAWRARGVRASCGTRGGRVRRAFGTRASGPGSPEAAARAGSMRAAGGGGVQQLGGCAVPRPRAPRSRRARARQLAPPPTHRRPDAAYHVSIPSSSPTDLRHVPSYNDIFSYRSTNCRCGRRVLVMCSMLVQNSTFRRDGTETTYKPLSVWKHNFSNMLVTLNLLVRLIFLNKYMHSNIFSGRLRNGNFVIKRSGLDLTCLSA